MRKKKAPPPSRNTCSLLAKGEVGSTVYIKYGTKSAYVQKGIITSKSGKLVAGLKPDNEGYYYVKLKDASGNASVVTKVKSKYFKKPGGSGLDGGKLVIQKKNGKDYKNTKAEISCASVKGYQEYLIDTYTTPAKSFFENMGAVQQGLDTLALYLRGTKDVNKKNTDLPYPMLTVSPYPELSLNEWYQMYESAEEPLFLNYLYPYILDSLGFPSVMANVAKRLDPSCQVQWGAYHYLVDVTKDGETRTYGGAGSGGNDPLYSNRVEKLFLFDGSAYDYAKNSTLESLSAKRSEYGEYATEDARVYRDLIHGNIFAETIGLGSWIRVGTEGLNLLNKSYAYVTQGCVYTEGSGSIPYSVENVWVDGRYINQYNRYEPGAKFSDYPNADIMVRDLAYTNKWGMSAAVM